MEPSAIEFSASVRTVAAELPDRDVTAWELAERLLTLHPEHGRADHVRPFLQNGGRRSVEQWLALVAGVAADLAVDVPGSTKLIDAGRRRPGAAGDSGRSSSSACH